MNQQFVRLSIQSLVFIFGSIADRLQVRIFLKNSPTPIDYERNLKKKTASQI